MLLFSLLFILPLACCLLLNLISNNFSLNCLSKTILQETVQGWRKGWGRGKDGHTTSMNGQERSLLKTQALAHNRDRWGTLIQYLISQRHLWPERVTGSVKRRCSVKSLYVTARPQHCRAGKSATFPWNMIKISLQFPNISYVFLCFIPSKWQNFPGTWFPSSTLFPGMLWPLYFFQKGACECDNQTLI